VAVLPLEGRSRDVVRTCLDRVDACLEAASKAAAETTTEAPDRRPRFRVQVAVEPVESRSLALPVVLLMERGDAALRTVQKPRTDSLSVRERQVAVELAGGRTKREVASALGLSFATRRAQLVNALAGLR
jgi:DNA-binding NarL/FixJ family response regulator